MERIAALLQPSVEAGVEVVQVRALFYRGARILYDGLLLLGLFVAIAPRHDLLRTQDRKHAQDYGYDKRRYDFDL